MKQSEREGAIPPFFFFQHNMSKKFKQDKGVAGLTILLSLIVMLFIIGLLVMIFSIMGAELKDSQYTDTTKTVGFEAVGNTTFLNGTGYTLASGTTDRNANTYTIVALYNNSNVLLTAGNYTLTNKVLTNATTLTYLPNLKVNYTYHYDADNDATNVMNDTISSVTTTTDWFDIFIVIGAMVVLILLTVIIITAIRSSGLVAGAGSQQNSVGTA